MIKAMDNSNGRVAEQIYSVFQQSYGVEAKLLNRPDFPPLKRTLRDIQHSTTEFFGYSEDGNLAAVIELSIHDKRLEIESLTVAPLFFRKGIAGKLLRYTLGTFDFVEAVVETAVANTPAIQLYMKHGFSEIKRWTPSHGIEKLALSR